MIVQLEIFTQMRKILYALLLHDNPFHVFHLASAQQEVRIHHSHICQVEHKFHGPQESPVIHLITFQYFVPEIYRFHAVIVVKHSVGTPVPLPLWRDVDLAHGGIVDCWDKMKDPPVANGHCEQLFIFASPPADFFGPGLNFLTGFTKHDEPISFVGANCSTKSSWPCEESCCQMRTRIKIVHVQVVTLIQQTELVHHLHDCFQNEGHFLGHPRHWTLPQFQHGLMWGIVALLYEWKHTFPLKLLCFFVPSLCPSWHLKTQAVTRISLWNCIQLQMVFVRLVLIEGVKPAHTMKCTGSLIQAKGTVWCKGGPEWTLESGNYVPDLGKWVVARLPRGGVFRESLSKCNFWEISSKLLSNMYSPKKGIWVTGSADQ